MYTYKKDMYVKESRIIFLCGKKANPSEILLDYINIQSAYTGRILRFVYCKSHPFKKNRHYYYNPDLKVYATV